jgi:hypothetical protein
MAAGIGAVRWTADQIASNAGEDLRLKEFHAGRLNSDGSFGWARAVGEVLGVLRGNPNTGDTSQIQYQDVSQACIGAAVAVNALLAPRAADGRFLTGTTGQRSVVRGLQAGTVDGQVVTALIGRVETA